MTDRPLLEQLVAQAVTATVHADDEEFLARCVVLTAHDLRDVHRALCAYRDAPFRVETVGEPATGMLIERQLEPGRVAATVRYLDTGEVGGVDEVDRIIDAILLLADGAPERC